MQDKMMRERERFVNSIDPEAVCRLASSYHNGENCKVFRPPKHGSFNVCWFVEFDLPAVSKDPQVKPDRWVVRIPISARVPWVDEKIEVEVATMRSVMHGLTDVALFLTISSYIAAKTRIPVPRIHAWSFIKGSSINEAYIIMDYVEGKSLSQLGFPDGPEWKGWPNKPKNLVRKQLADVYIQLRSLEFSSIGALGLPVKTSSPTATEPGGPLNDKEADDHSKSANPLSTDVSGITVRHRPMPVELLMQEVEGRDPARIIPRGKTFKTSNEYSNALLSLADNNLDKATDMWLDTRDSRDVIYGSYDFKRFVTEEWLDPALNDGPFVLMHGDLSFHGGNLLWDENYRLLAVLDWEWSYVVPVQHFVPPLWLIGFYDVLELAVRKRSWMWEVQVLRHAIKAREKMHGFPPHLSDEWEKMEEWPHILIALGLLRPESIFHVYWGFLTCQISGLDADPERDLEKHAKIMTERIDAFFKDTPSAEVLLARKVEEQKQFDEEFEKYREEMAAASEECQCVGCKQDGVSVPI